MRKRVAGDVTVNAISGTHIVMFGFDMAPAATKDLLGFAIQRHDKTEQEVTWLRGNKSFASIRDISGNEDVSSHAFPFQAFQWADYTAKPGYDYEYRVFPMFGKPGKLREGNATTVRISTEQADGDKYSVYFNRAAIASQAYAKRFITQDPDDPEPSAWLARDLLPGMLKFIERAKDDSHGLYAAIFETRFDPVLQAFREAHQRKAKVRIIYGATPDAGTTQDNDAAIDAAKIRSLCKGRENAKLMHNKFIVLTKNERPVAVWTGSTNLSRNAIVGQLNVGIAVEDAALARKFKAYWDRLVDDPESDEIKDWVEENNPLPADGDGAPLVDLLAPHRGTDLFNYYCKVAKAAERGLFMTFPFGIVKDFRPVYDKRDGVLRYALLDKYVNGGNATSRAEAIKDTIRIRKLANVGMALGNRIFVDSIDGWMKEASPLGVNVNWVHTKFMLVDPLGPNPTVITGSANWSLPSTNANDENMLVIRGDKRVADIHLTEFMRIFAHHRFRESVARYIEENKTTKGWKPQDLKEKAEEWVPAHYRKGSEYELRRLYFSGST